MQTKHFTLAVAMAAVLSLSLSETAEAQSLTDPGSLQLSAGGSLAFAGSLQQESMGNDVSIDLDPGFGAELQGVVPLGDMFFVGGNFAFRSLKADLVDDRSNFMGIDAVFGAHYAIDLGSIVIDPFVAIRLGLGIALPVNDGDDTEFGLDSGFRAGAHVWFTPMIGAYLALGYQRGDFFPDEDVHTRVHQFETDIGVTIRLGN